MNLTHETSTDTLALIKRRVPGVSSHFERQKWLMNQRLKSTIHTSRDILSEQRVYTGFGSAWLPGPLSYPWLLMFAGIPMIFEHLLRQV